MHPTCEFPSAGRFVLDQVQAIRDLDLADTTIDYEGLPRKVTGPFGSLLKYGRFGLAVLWRAVRKPRYDIVHVHFFVPTVIVALLYRMLRTPGPRIVATFHGSDIYAYKETSVYRFLLSRLDVAIAVSAGLGARLLARGLAAEKLHVIPAGILPVYVAHAKDSGQQNIDLLFVGSLVPIKGVDRLVAMLSHVRPLRVIIVGKGPLCNEIGAISEHGHDVLHIPSCRPNELVSLYRSSRFLVSPSRQESFGLVIAEAMAVGTPVIATRTDGALEQVLHNESGLLIDGDCDEDIAVNGAAMITHALSLDARTYERLGSAAAQSAARYRLDTIAPAIADIYKALAAQSR